jgi:hypothetical protein
VSEGEGRVDLYIAAVARLKIQYTKLDCSGERLIGCHKIEEFETHFLHEAGIYIVG